MRKMLLFFIDGLGLGADSPENPVKDLFATITGGVPLTKAVKPVFFENGVLIPTDAVLGVDGIPQSATGQTSIFTGCNAQQTLGYHLSAYPNDTLKRMIEEHSIMKVLKDCGVDVTSANLYSNEFFEKRLNTHRNMFPASTLTIQASGVDFRFPEHFQAGKAVFADITNELIRKRGYEIPLSEPEEAAGKMLNILSEHQFVFFEYFMTDLYGHRRDAAGLASSVEIINRFTGAIWREVTQDDTVILVVSDHGNAEDLSTPEHTLNRVPTLVLSRESDAIHLFGDAVHDLTDIHLATRRYFGCD